jgi:hypothetical protein
LIKCVGNNRFFDRWIIVTEEWDKNTLDVCKSSGLEYVFSKKIHDQGFPFAKGKAINEGLEKLKRNDWLLQIDSDILLRDNFKTAINFTHQNTNTLYWMDRYVEKNGVMIKRNKGNGVGYFQLWHSSVIKTYPDKCHNACVDDKLHRNYFLNTDGLEMKRIRGTSCIDVSGDNKFHSGRKYDIFK